MDKKDDILRVIDTLLSLLGQQFQVYLAMSQPIEATTFGPKVLITKNEK